MSTILLEVHDTSVFVLFCFCCCCIFGKFCHCGVCVGSVCCAFGTAVALAKKLRAAD